MADRWDEDLTRQPAGGNVLGWALRRLLLWIVVGTAVVAAITYRDVIFGLVESVQTQSTAPSPAGKKATGKSSSQAHRTITIPRGRGGHFWVTARVGDSDVRFLVDTGATAIVMDPGDAERIGLRLRDRNFTKKAQTAGGVVRMAPVTLRRLRIGALTLHDLDAFVNETPIGNSLLGIAFLKRLDGYKVQGDKLILYW
jgi:aspartyl protease family protein